MSFPSTPGGLAIWIVAIIVICLAAAFLFQQILLPLIKTIT